MQNDTMQGMQSQSMQSGALNKAQTPVESATSLIESSLSDLHRFIDSLEARMMAYVREPAPTAPGSPVSGPTPPKVFHGNFHAQLLNIEERIGSAGSRLKDLLSRLSL